MTTTSTKKLTSILREFNNILAQSYAVPLSSSLVVRLSLTIPNMVSTTKLAFFPDDISFM